MRIAAPRVVAAVALVGAALVTSCGGSTTPSPAASASASPLEAPATTAAPSGPTGKVAKLKDAKADLTNANGGNVTGRAFIDIVGVSGQVVNGQLAVTVTVTGKVAASYSTTKGEVTYLVAIERDGSGDSDYWLTLTNREDGSWVPELTDWASSDTYPGEEFPGAGSASKSTISFRVDLAAIGSPHDIRLSVITQVAKSGTDDIVAQDQAPAGRQYLPGPKWLTVVVPGG